MVLFNRNIWISIEISLKFVTNVPTDNKPSLIQMIAWHCGSDNSLALNRQQAIIWTNDGLIILYIDELLSLQVLNSYCSESQFIPAGHTQHTILS